MIDDKLIMEILERGNDVEIRKRPRTGEILILEVKKTIKQGNAIK